MTAEAFINALIGDRDLRESFVLETSETAAILEDRGCDEFEAFREAVRLKMNEVKHNDQNSNQEGRDERS